MSFNKCIATAAVLAISVITAGTQPAHSENAVKDAPDFAPGRIIVKLEDQASSGDLASLNRRNDARVEEKLTLDGLSVVDLPKDLSVTEAVRRYEGSPSVEYAEPDYEVYAQETVTPNDSSFPKMYNLNNTGQTYGSVVGTPDADIDAPEAWSITTGTASTVVGVIDTGVDINHPDLRENVWTNPDEIAGNNKDDDGNGYVDDIHGWDFYHNDNSVFDSATDDRHGTLVSGIIGAKGNNGIGATGIGWRTKVMPLKFLGPGGKGYISDATEALDYAVSEGVKISNNSYAYRDNCSGCYSRTLLDAIDRAKESGHLFVAAAANGGDDSIGDNNDLEPAPYPASYKASNIISVAASNNRDQMTSFSNYGATSVDLAAPGLGVYTTAPGNTYLYGYGTSMSAPHVAGVAALVKSKFPGLDDAGIKSKILSSVDRKASFTGKMTTGGRLNAARALGATTTTAPVQTAPANTAPTVGNMKPKSRKIRDRTPRITASVRDSQTDMSKSNIRLYVDGRNVSRFSYNRSTNLLTYTPSRKLEYRWHTVKVVARDPGNLSGSGFKRFKVVR